MVVASLPLCLWDARLIEPAKVNLETSANKSTPAVYSRIPDDLPQSHIVAHQIAPAPAALPQPADPNVSNFKELCVAMKGNMDQMSDVLTKSIEATETRVADSVAGTLKRYDRILGDYMRKIKSDHDEHVQPVKTELKDAVHVILADISDRYVAHAHGHGRAEAGAGRDDRHCLDLP